MAHKEMKKVLHFSPLRVSLKKYFRMIIASLGVLFLLMVIIIAQLFMEEMNAGAQGAADGQTLFLLILVIGGLVCTRCLVVTVHSIGNMYRFFEKYITFPLERESRKKPVCWQKGS